MFRIVCLFLALLPVESFRPQITRRMLLSTGLPITMHKSITNDRERSDSLIYVANNSLYFSGGLDEESIFGITANIINLQKQKVRRINLHLQSSGGALLPSLGLVDLIRTSDIPIYTYVNGYVASAASLISIVGTKRFIGRHGVILIHQLKMGTDFSKYNEIKDYYENSETLMNIIREIYLENSCLSESKLEYLLEHDFWLNSTTCKEYNLIDEII